jgi:Transposase DDE domain/Transposase domain (DUF772)
MRHFVDPRQTRLLDPAETMFSPKAIELMLGDWPGLFRAQLLHLMPVDKIATNFHPTFGRPTKELYSMAGALFLKEMFDLTIAQAVAHYVFDGQWHYALNLVPTEVSMSHSTIERYMSLLASDDEVFLDIFERVTAKLVQALELDVTRQRLDSTHIFSDMASFGRTRLMGVAIQRFLVQLKRHHRELYDALPPEVRTPYERSQANMFGDHRGTKDQLRQNVAEQLLGMVNRFAGDAAVAARTSYQAMVRILHEQCIVTEQKVELRRKVGATVMQNPSDPDAGYDGHKGQGYQVQISETCGPDNDAQLITGLDVQSASASDQEAVMPMLEQLATQGRTPEVLYADTHYGRDENVQAAQAKGVDLQSPVGGTAPQNEDDLTADDFVIDEQTETVQVCPNGCTPLSSRHDAATGTTVTVMSKSDCENCSFRQQCPVVARRQGYVLRHTAAQRRSAARRAEQDTDAFRKNYSIRAGIESTNSGLKRRMGLGRLRTRGLRRMRVAAVLRCAGWNIFQAVRGLKKRGNGALAALVAACAAYRRPLRALAGLMAALRTQPTPDDRNWRSWYPRVFAFELHL